MNSLQRELDDLIDSYAIKGAEWYMSAGDIPRLEQDSLVDYLFNNDPVTREMLIERIQDLLDSRINDKQTKSNRDKGLKSYIDKINGETRFIGVNK